MAKPRRKSATRSRCHALRQPEQLEHRLVMDGAGFVNTDPAEDPDSIVGAAGIVANDDYPKLPAGTKSIRISPLVNDELPEGATRLTIKSASATAQGANVSITDDGQHLIYTATGDEGFQSWDSFYYIVQTADGRLGKANVQLGGKYDSGPINPPIRSYDRYTVLEDSGETRLDVLRNDPLTDPTIVSVSVPTRGGTVRISDDGSALFYAPKYGTSGYETFTYAARDADGTEQHFQVEVRIEKPYKVVSTYRNTDNALLDFGAGPVMLDPLANDSFVGPDSVVPVIESFTFADYAGEITLADDGRSLRYDPADGYLGSFSVSYTVRYGEAEHQTTTGSFSVSVQRHSLAVENWFAVDPNATEPAALDVLANDPVLDPYRYDYDRNAHYLPPATTNVTKRLVDVSQATSGAKVSIDAATGTLRYTPAEGFRGDDTFTYTMVDSTGLAQIATVTVHVAEPISDPSGAERFATRGELEQYLIDRAVRSYQSQFGRVYSRYAPQAEGYHEPRVMLFDTDVVAADTSGFNADHSDTNTQVSGVDEADIVETDGRYVYTFTDGQLAIVDLLDPEQPVLVSLTSFDGAYDKMYLMGDRITLLRSGQLWHYRFDEPASAEVLVLDIAERSAVNVVERTEVDGYIADSRAIEGRVHLVVQRNFVLPELEGKWLVEPVLPDEGEAPQEPAPLTQTGASDAIFGLVPYYFDYGEPGVWQNESLDEYLARVRETLIDTSLPKFRSYDASGERVASGLLSEPTSVHKPIGSQDVLVSLATLDAMDNVPGPVAEATTFISDTHTRTYVSATTAYVFAYDSATDTTTLYKMALEADGSSPIVATGQIRGRMLNQFSADESGGYLRVATTQQERETLPNGQFRQLRLFNNLLVLEQQDNRLVQVGEVTNLAPTETIHAVRFMGERAYVVTFRRVDPLFAIDLSDPTAPTVEGALKIPGFSNYLHPVGQNYLIGIGRDANEITGRLGPLQITLFDVSDLSDPKVADQLTLEGAYSVHSEAWFDHHAVAFFAESGVLAIPINWREAVEVSDDHGGTRLDSVVRSVIATVDVKTNGNAKLKATGIIDHEMPIAGSSTRFSSSTTVIIGGDSHSLQSSPARRALRIGESLITVSNHWVKVHELKHPDTQLGELYIGPPARDDKFEVDEDSGTTTLDVLANDFPAAGGEIARVDSVEQPSTGATVTIADDGLSLAIAPDENFNGQVRFSYTMIDPLRGEQTAVVIVDINAVDDNPIAHDDEYALDANVGPTKIDVLVNDENPDYRHWYGWGYQPFVDFVSIDVVAAGQVREAGGVAGDFVILPPWRVNDLRVVEVGETSHGGTLELNDYGGLLYTPAADFVGAETFTYTVANASGLTDTATVTVYVGTTPAEVAPPFTAQPVDDAVELLFARPAYNARPRASRLAVRSEVEFRASERQALWTEVVDQVHDERSTGDAPRSDDRNERDDERLDEPDVRTSQLRQRKFVQSVRSRLR